MNEATIPSFVKPFLWSYDTDQLDLRADQERIITNVLNLGTEEAVRWLFTVYDKEDVKKVISQPRPGEWNEKSLNYWSLIFNLPTPTHVLRNLR